MSKYFLSLLCLASTYAAAAQNVGIGTTIPAATLDVAGNVKITDGTQGAGKLLTSGADGTATWKIPAAAACFFFNTDQTVSNLNYVGLGSTSSDFLRNSFIVPFPCELTSITLSTRLSSLPVTATLYLTSGPAGIPVQTPLSVTLTGTTSTFATAPGSLILVAGTLISVRIFSQGGALPSGVAVSVTYK